MNRIISFVAVACLMLSTTTSCYVRVNDKLIDFSSAENASVKPSGEIETKTFSYEKIQSICINNGMLEYIQGTENTPCVTITADKNYFEHIEVTGEDGAVYVKSKIKNLRSGKDIQITVYSPDLEAMAIVGAGDAHAESINANADLFNATISGAGDLTIDSFKGNDLHVSVSGSGDVVLEAVESHDVNISVSGSGDVDANFVKANDVVASFSGAGDITLSGECNVVNVGGAGAGSIDIRALKYSDSKISKSGSVSIKK